MPQTSPTTQGEKSACHCTLLRVGCVGPGVRGIWIPKALEFGHVREYWDDSDIDELEALTLDANAAVE
jgi:hypothetical protein